MPRPVNRRLALACRILLAVELLYSMAAAVIAPLPGWKMFARVEHFDFELLDRSAKPVDLYSYLPKGSYLQSAFGARAVARFAARHEAGRGPFTLVDHVTRKSRVLPASEIAGAGE